MSDREWALDYIDELGELERERTPTLTPNGVTGSNDSTLEPIHRLIGPRAECCPDAIAAVHGGKSLEVAIADIWKELLGVERVTRHDNFFDLGGHSLLAMRLITKIESSTGCRLTLLQLASGSVPTIAQHITASSEPTQDVWPGMGAWLGSWLRRLTSAAAE